MNMPGTIIREQDGTPERQLKFEWNELLKRWPLVRKAFLVQVNKGLFRRKADVALLITSAAKRDEDLVRKCGDLFAKRFRTNEHLDISWITPERELAVVRAAKPFFVNRRHPDYVLSSSESITFSNERLCYLMRRLGGRGSDDYAVVFAEPAAPESAARQMKDLSQLVLATREAGATLFPLSKGSVAVHIGRLLIDHPELQRRRKLSTNDIEVLAWGDVTAWHGGLRTAGS